jgi:hypothetical protein
MEAAQAKRGAPGTHKGVSGLSVSPQAGLPAGLKLPLWSLKRTLRLCGLAILRDGAKHRLNRKIIDSDTVAFLLLLQQCVSRLFNQKGSQHLTINLHEMIGSLGLGTVCIIYSFTSLLLDK